MPREDIYLARVVGPTEKGQRMQLWVFETLPGVWTFFYDVNLHKVSTAGPFDGDFFYPSKEAAIDNGIEQVRKALHEYTFSIFDEQVCDVFFSAQQPDKITTIDLCLLSLMPCW